MIIDWSRPEKLVDIVRQEFYFGFLYTDRKIKMFYDEKLSFSLEPSWILTLKSLIFAKQKGER